MVRRAIGRSLCVCVICANGSPGPRNNAMNHDGTPAIDFAPRFANFFESDFTGTLANPPLGDILFLLLIEQESSNQVFRAYRRQLMGWQAKGRGSFRILFLLLCLSDQDFGLMQQQRKRRGNGETHRVKEIFDEEKGSLLSIFRTTKGYFLRLPIGKRITDGSII